MNNFRGGFGGGGFGGANIGALMKQAQKMQEDIQKGKEEILNTEFRSSKGGGAVEVVMMGDKKIKSVKIKKEIIDPDDAEMLEDLIIAAVNDAISQIEKLEAEKLPALPM